MIHHIHFVCETVFFVLRISSLVSQPSSFLMKCPRDLRCVQCVAPHYISWLHIIHSSEAEISVHFAEELSEILLKIARNSRENCGKFSYKLNDISLIME